MAFQTTTFFAVAHNGTEPQLIAAQGPRVIDANAVGVISFNLVGTASLLDGGGTNLSGGAFHTAFAVAHTTGDNGTLSFVQSGFNALPAVDQDSLAKAFATAGTLVLQVEVTTGTGTTPQNLTVLLGAIRSNDFIVNPAGSSAKAALHPGSAGPNLAAPPGTYSFECSDLSAASLGSNADTFAVTAAAPPAQLFNRTLKININTTAPAIVATCELPINLCLHTECVITVDRSGSMGAATPTTDTKWNEAVKAATLFWTLYGEAVPTRTTAAPVTTLSAQSLTRFGRWRSLPGFDVEYEPAAFQPAATAADPTAGLAPGGGTPIGQALFSAKGLFTSGAWLRRHLLLLTDGMDNSGSPTLLEVVAAPATNLPLLSASAANGVIVHTISYAVSGDVPVYNLHTLATDHNGVFLGSELDSDTFSADLLRERFVDVLSRVLPVQLANNAPGVTGFNVEDGVDRIVFVAPGAGALSAAGPNADVTDSAGTAGGFTWAAANNPEPGLWTVAGAASTTRIHAIFDVALRLTESVTPSGLGQPVKVRAVLDFRGQPVTGAEVWAGVRRPGESIGEVITSFVRKRGLARAVQPRGTAALLHPDLGPMLAARSVTEAGRDKAFISAAVAARGVSAANGDTKSLQRLLLEAAERARNLELQSLGHALLLVEVEPGVYEGEIPGRMTQEEGVYDFAFLAEGETPGGNAFKRNQRRSIALAPLPSAEHSESQINLVSAGSVAVVTVFPKTVTGRPLGPGLGYALGFHYAAEAQRKQLPAPVTTDNLDGTYSTQIALAKGEKLAPLVLAFGSGPADIAQGLPIDDKRRPRRVRVRLDKIQVLDDKDGCFTGAGELVFDAIVAPNSNPARAVRTRLPGSGVLKANSGQQLAINQVIYEGLVEAGATLSIAIGGRELDYLLLFRREEKLARYHRVLPLQSAHLTPGDEPNDPESLRDWKVWYTVEVE